MDDRRVTTEEDPRDAGESPVEGTVVEALPHGLYRVVLARQRQVTAHLAGGPGRNFIRVLVGERVRVELMSRDVTRGRIVGVVR
jgi:translation initiation factor IF-1